MRRRRNPETIAGRVNSLGVPVAGDEFTCQRTATGTYLITLAPDFRLLAATVTAAFGTAVDSFTANGFRVQTFGTSLAVVDFPFSFTAVAVRT
jgi:hypothetical protein